MGDRDRRVIISFDRYSNSALRFDTYLRGFSHIFLQNKTHIVLQVAINTYSDDPHSFYLMNILTLHMCDCVRPLYYKIRTGSSWS